MCKDAGIHTAIDTVGVRVTPDVKKLLTYTDLVLLDIKSIYGDMYKKITGQEIDDTLEFAGYLAKIKKVYGCAMCLFLDTLMMIRH